MPDQIVSPARNLDGAVRPPGDKSISHRYALLAALADGVSTIENYSGGADCASTLACLEALGARVERGEGKVEIHGAGPRGLRAPAGGLDAGNSGSTMRMLAGILAAQPFASEIGGDGSLSRRPMKRVIEPLGRMGARIEAADGRPPLRFSPSEGLRGIVYALPVASAQVKSALLLAGLFAQGTTAVIEPLATRDHTEIALRAMGAEVRSKREPGGGRRIEMDGPVAALAPLAQARVPGDPSSAAFFLCAAAMFPDARVTIDQVSLNPTRSALLDVLARLGLKPQVTSIEERDGELAGGLHLSGARRLGGAVIAGAEAVALIDEAPILAVLATATGGGIEFKDAGELRVKESDRIAAIAANLRAMGGVCDERPDGFFVPGGQKLRGARIATFHDHRIAMAFAIAALAAEGDSVIENAECAAVSYPDFFPTLERIVER